eukprot:2712553-Rhodomonas_salina.2
MTDAACVCAGAVAGPGREAPPALARGGRCQCRGQWQCRVTRRPSASASGTRSNGGGPGRGRVELEFDSGGAERRAGERADGEDQALLLQPTRDPQPASGAMAEPSTAELTRYSEPDS